MSKRTERREAERTARKLAYQQLRQQQPSETPQEPEPQSQPEPQPELTGRAASARNAIKHGCCAGDTLILKSERIGDYKALEATWFQAYKPKTDAEKHPHAVRTKNLDHPDELRVDLDPGPGVEWPDVRRVALEVKSLLDELGLQSWPKTSGSRGMHINVRIHPRWSFDDVRRAALALSRAIERRAPTLATSQWWKEERHGVFLDYNQNAKDRTTCSAYSVRPVPDARVSTPLHWHEVPGCDPADFNVLTVPERFANIGDPHAAMDDAPASLEPLLELAAKDEAQGLGDAPWPPHFRKTTTEAPRVAPSRARARKTMPLITVANSPGKEAALAGLERWKASHAEAATHLAADDILVDSMRGRSSTWTRIRINLRHVPENIRPKQEAPDPDDDPTR